MRSLPTWVSVFHKTTARIFAATIVVLIVVFVFRSVRTFAQESKYGESIDVQLVEIDLVVTDRAGHHVTGLTANDFEVFEGGRRKQITNLTEYRDASARPIIANQRKTAADLAGAMAPENKRLPQTLLVLIDALPRQGRGRVMHDLETLVDNVILEGDRVTVEMTPYDLTKGRITFRKREGGSGNPSGNKPPSAANK